MINNKNTDKYLHGSLARKTGVGVFLVLLLLLGGSGKNTFGAASTARVGILPFQIFSGENVEYLNGIIADKLSEQLKTKEGVAVISREEINKMSKRKTGAGAFSLQELSVIAERTGAHFLIYGSLTKIEDNVSIDARVFTTLEPSPPHKDFVEGKDFDLLLKNLGDKVSRHISQVVLVSPPPTVIEKAPQVAESVSPSQEEQPPVTEVTLNKQASEPAVVAAPEASSEQTAAAPETLSEPALSAPTKVQATTKEVAPSSEAPQVAEAVSPSQEEQVPAAEANVNRQTSKSKTVVAPETSSARPQKTASDDKTQSSKPKAFSSSDQPVNITSDRMVADNRNRTVSFLGNVVAKREDMIIFSDQLSAVYTDQSKIEKLIARGNVKINQSDRTATCQEATFFQLRQQIVMTGKPKVWQNKNIITGDKIIIFVKEDRVEIESDKPGSGKPSRVNAIIYPGGKGFQQ